MRITVLTSNSFRHRYVANELTRRASDALVVAECRPADAAVKNPGTMTAIESHFYERHLAERRFFGAEAWFLAKTLATSAKEVNLPDVHEAVRKFRPDAMFVFGTGILKEHLISCVPAGRFVNMHLGLSPYYRGAGTNFWPIANGELEYVGASILHLDAGVDTGDIIAHARPAVEPGDDGHAIGCRTIVAGTKIMAACLDELAAGRELPRHKQWPVENSRYYKNADFTESALSSYREKLQGGLVERYLRAPRDLRLVPWIGR